MDDPIRHIGHDRMGEGDDGEAEKPPKSELEAEEELLKEWNREEPEAAG